MAAADAKAAAEPLLAGAADHTPYNGLSSAGLEGASGPGGLVCDGVSVDVPIKGMASRKTILHSVSAYAKQGEVLAIMGPSGCGKTTLLNACAGFVNLSAGSVRFSPGDGGDAGASNHAAYVTQDNYLFDMLSVQETVEYAADLRLPHGTPASVRAERVATVLQEMGLHHVAGSKIGGHITRGVSGGEKKRVSIACELLHRPSLLFLDEPTSGLDSATSLQVVRHLRHLARNNRTVLLSIHQPRASVFSMFDRVLLLARGRTVYFGPPRGVLTYFDGLGTPCPALCNPADFLLDLVGASPADPAVPTAPSSSTRGTTVVSMAMPAADGDMVIAAADPVGLADAFLGSTDAQRLAQEVAMVHGPAPVLASSQGTSLGARFHTFTVLLRRSWVTMMRNPILTYARLGQAIVLSLLVGALFWQVKRDQAGVQNRAGCFFFLVTNTLFSSMGQLRLFSEEKEIFFHERRSGAVNTAAYFWGKLIAELGPSVVFSVLWCVVVYWMVGLRPEAGHFLRFILALLVTAQVGESYVIAVAALVPSDRAANLIAPLFLALSLLFGGFFANLGTIPAFLAWLKFLSMFRYSFAALLINELSGLGPFKCDPNACPFPSGDAALSSYQLGPLTYWENVLVLLVFAVGFRAIAQLALTFSNRAPKRKAPSITTTPAAATK